ncbi:hypothetical protein KM043_007381 [Ampulex compressa]|nr:hypothetical protein KM043_007381 [Ampulex compressa]
MAILGNVRLLIYISLTAVIVGEVSEARNVKHRHGHHGYGEHQEREDGAPRALSLQRLEVEHLDPRNRQSSRQTGRNHQRGQVHSLRTGPRQKRQNAKHRAMQERNGGQLLRSRGLGRLLLQDAERASKSDDFYLLEVRQAQDISLCNYTVQPVRSLRGTRTPLEEVICKHRGSTCHDESGDSYCCIQIYTKVVVKNANNVTEEMNLRSGCVCAHQRIDDLDSSEQVFSTKD